MSPPRLLDEPQKRIARLRQLIAKLEANRHVQNRDIEKVLTPEQREAFCCALEEARGSTTSGLATLPYPHELDRYLNLVDQGTLEYAKGERLKGKLSSHARYRASEALFERAREALEETLGIADSTTRAAIHYWLDRPISHSEEGTLDIGLDPSSVPRKRGSRSKFTRERTIAFTSGSSVRQVKEGHLRNALEGLLETAPTESDIRKQTDRLQQLTKLVRR